MALNKMALNKMALNKMALNKMALKNKATNKMAHTNSEKMSKSMEELRNTGRKQNSNKQTEQSPPIANRYEVLGLETSNDTAEQNETNLTK